MRINAWSRFVPAAALPISVVGKAGGRWKEHGFNWSAWIDLIVVWLFRGLFPGKIKQSRETEFKPKTRNVN